MKQLWSLVAVAAIALGAPALAQDAAKPTAKPGEKQVQPAQDGKKEGKKDEAKKDKVELKIGEKAPEFTLKDTEGKEHALSSLSGKVVVLEWFNPDCPFVVKQHEVTSTMADLVKKYGDKVVFLAINSSAPGKQGSGQERNAKAKTDWKIDFPILLDETGEVGKAYQSKNTPTMYVIDTAGKLAYWGAIDDDSGPDKAGKTNYVAKALDEILAGKPVSQSKTKPYGCNVKY
ncbi:MAG: thioredoxin family protein [Phycisphaerae bacterium]|nr:thioredoxin family protein [Phycisphaerae bacterium]